MQLHYPTVLLLLLPLLLVLIGCRAGESDEGQLLMLSESVMVCSKAQLAVRCMYQRLAVASAFEETVFGSRLSISGGRGCALGPLLPCPLHINSKHQPPSCHGASSSALHGAHLPPDVASELHSDRPASKIFSPQAKPEQAVA